MKLLSISRKREYLLIPDLVWDGISAQTQKNRGVLIKDGLIQQVVPLLTTEQPSSILKIIHLSGITLMPGLVDCHMHFSMNCENLFQAIEDWHNRPRLVADNARLAAADYLSNGVLAVRDGSDKMNIGLNIRDNIRQGIFPGPLVTATGEAIFRKGKYGEFLGPGVDAVEDALAQVELFCKNGIDQLKVVVSGLVSFKDFGVVGPLQFSVSELKVIVDKAHQLGLRVMAHASSAAAVETAVKSGVDSVEHGYFIETAQLELMALNKTAWIPTLAPLGNLVTSGHMPYSGANAEVIKKSFELQLSRLYEAYKLGVNLGVGTDAGANQVTHGFSYHQELQYYAQAGLDNATILHMATLASAAIIGQEKHIGSMLPGRAPYLIGLTGSPFDSLAHLKSPNLVILPE